MYERCLNEAERVLAADNDVIVAVKKVWMEVSREAKTQVFDVPSLPDFTAMLEGDPRFEFLPAHSSLQDDLDDPHAESVSKEESELEQLGFFSGDRVKLRHVELTPRRLGTIIRTKVDRTMDALTKAWDLRPEGDQDTEDRLLEILARTQKLQKEVKKAFSTSRMKTLEHSLEKKKRPPSGKKTSKRKVPAGKKAASKSPSRKKNHARGKRKK
ncbi:MAG: hypothetical protein WEB37_11835 [Bacteroidota bacterium]